MTHDEVRRILAELHDARCAIDAANVERDALIDGLLTAEQRTQMREIRDEFSERVEAARARCELLETQARDAVRALGETVKGDGLSAVWAKPSTTWDTDGLLAMSKNPEFAWLREFMKTGEPRIQIRANKS